MKHGQTFNSFDSPVRLTPPGQCPPVGTTLLRRRALAVALGLGLLWAAPATAMAQAVPYGPSGTLGPAGAATRSCSGIAKCSVCTPSACTPSGGWQSRIENASPGDTILLRAGTYNPVGSLDVPAGTASSPIILANYNRESVQITGPVVFGNGNVRVEGLTIDAATKSGWSIIIDSRTSTVKSNIELKNLDVRGGTTEAVRIRGNVRDITIRNSLLDGGRDHHVMKVMCDDTGRCSRTPENISIVNNRFSKATSSFFPRPSTNDSEDLLQTEGAGNIAITRNHFGNNRYEECVDIKPQGRSGTSIVFSGNVVDSTSSSGCRLGGMLFQQTQTSGSTVIEGNWFPGVGNLVRATHAGTRMVNNVFGQVTVSANEVTLGYNTFAAGSELKFGDSRGRPSRLTIINNILYRTSFRGSGSYTATRNVRFQTSGTFTCSDCPAGDPLLSGYKIQSGSSAQNAASSSFTVTRDIEGTSRPKGSAYDIGAYERAP